MGLLVAHPRPLCPLLRRLSGPVSARPLPAASPAGALLSGATCRCGCQQSLPPCCPWPPTAARAGLCFTFGTRAACSTTPRKPCTWAPSRPPCREWSTACHCARWACRCARWGLPLCALGECTRVDTLQAAWGRDWGVPRGQHPCGRTPRASAAWRAAGPASPPHAPPAHPIPPHPPSSTPRSFMAAYWDQEQVLDAAVALWWVSAGLSLLCTGLLPFHFFFRLPWCARRAAHGMPCSEMVPRHAVPSAGAAVPPTLCALAPPPCGPAAAASTA